ncbi:MAG: hypothetical protein AAGC55_18260, partial [Myxococcota bacterium]
MGRLVNGFGGVRGHVRGVEAALFSAKAVVTQLPFLPRPRDGQAPQLSAEEIAALRLQCGRLSELIFSASAQATTLIHQTDEFGDDLKILWTLSG